MEPTYWLTTQFEAGDELEHQLAEIRRLRRTGALTINFSEGSPSAGFSWKERLRGSNGQGETAAEAPASAYDPAERHLVNRDGKEFA